MGDMTKQKTGRQFKDTLFRALFDDSERFLELYNAVANEHYPADTIITPCPSNDLLAKFNDLAACIGDQLVVFFEHQSTISKNMPLRLLSYVTDILYLHIVDRDKLYGKTQLMIPTPKFYVLYNGQQRLDTSVVKLSDAYISHDPDPAMEITAKIVDINLSSGETALDRSVTLHGYSLFIEKIRGYQLAGMTRDKAIVTAINECIKENILTEFLTEHYTEVIKMLNWEYDPEVERRVLDEEAREEGLKRGLEEGRQQGMQEGRQQGMQEGRQEGRQEGMQQGMQQGVELLAGLIKEGMSLDEALIKVKTKFVNPQ